jgi:archaellum biogenesis protein FlaJ (TadC family)
LPLRIAFTSAFAAAFVFAFALVVAFAFLSVILGAAGDLLIAFAVAFAFAFALTIAVAFLSVFLGAAEDLLHHRSTPGTASHALPAPSRSQHRHISAERTLHDSSRLRVTPSL